MISGDAERFEGRVTGERDRRPLQPLADAARKSATNWSTSRARCRRSRRDIGGQQFNMGFGEGTITSPAGSASWAPSCSGSAFSACSIVFLALCCWRRRPRQVRRIGEETSNRIFAAFFVGLLGYLAYWILLLLLLPTCWVSSWCWSLLRDQVAWNRGDVPLVRPAPRAEAGPGDVAARGGAARIRALRVAHPSAPRPSGWPGS